MLGAAAAGTGAAGSLLRRCGLPARRSWASGGFGSGIGPGRCGAAAALAARAAVSSSGEAGAGAGGEEPARAASSSRCLSTRSSKPGGRNGRRAPRLNNVYKYKPTVDGDGGDGKGGPADEGGLTDALVEMTNRSFRDYPRETLVSMFCLELLSIYGTHKALVLSGVVVPASFAVAFALSRPLRKFRFPLEVLGAGALCRAVPALRHVEITTAMRGTVPEQMKGLYERAPQFMRQGADKLGSVVDSYGAAYFIAARWTGCAVVLGLYGAIHNGLNVEGYLQGLGVAEAGDVLGTWAAAVVCSSAIYPLTLLSGAYLAPRVAPRSARRR